jgi:hypothetical protein
MTFRGTAGLLPSFAAHHFSAQGGGSRKEMVR